jgi:hypothetical protein
MEEFFALHAEPRYVSLKLCPQNSIIVRYPGHSDDSACLQNRIKRCEVA